MLNGFIGHAFSELLLGIDVKMVGVFLGRIRLMSASDQTRRGGISEGSEKSSRPVRFPPGGSPDLADSLHLLPKKRARRKSTHREQWRKNERVRINKTHSWASSFRVLCALLWP